MTNMIYSLFLFALFIPILIKAKYKIMFVFMRYVSSNTSIKNGEYLFIVLPSEYCIIFYHVPDIDHIR